MKVISPDAFRTTETLGQAQRILHRERRVYVCDFNNPDDAFSRFILTQWQTFQSA